MIVARLTVLAVAAIGVVLALDPNSNVFQIVSFAWAGFGAAFGPLMLLSLFWKRTNLWGALAGMITGGATVFIWKFVVRPMGGILNIYELLPAFIVSLFFIVLVSLITGKPKADVVADYETYKADMALTSEEFNAALAPAAAVEAAEAVEETAEEASAEECPCCCAECAAAEETAEVETAEEAAEEIDEAAAAEAAMEAECATACSCAECAAEEVAEAAEEAAEVVEEAAEEIPEVIEETVVEIPENAAE